MADLSPYAKALLETISGPESAGDYNVIYGGSQFDDYTDHPRTPVMITSGPNKGQYSTAAGKYQFLGSTWDDQAKRLGLPDFSPASQDAAAWNLAQEEYRRDTGRSLEADLAAGDLSRVPSSLRNQWTSLPGGIEQGITGSGFSSAYARALNNPAVNAINGAAPARLPAIGPTGGPAASGNWWANPFQSAKAMIPGLAGQVAAAPQQAKAALAPSMLGSIAGRTAIMNAIMPSNIGSSPMVRAGTGGPGTAAMSVGRGGSAPVMLAGSGINGRASGSSPMFSREGQDMNVYRANRNTIGGPITAASIAAALNAGNTLYAPRGRSADSGTAQSLVG